MTRPDLLALKNDDLIVLSNRGLVKRASKELDAGDLSYELTEDEAGNVTIKWSDNIECLIPANTTLNESRCSCPATTICRHLIRSVLAYRQTVTADLRADLAADGITDGGRDLTDLGTDGAADLAAGKVWNPGEIKDEELAKHYQKTTLNRINKEFASGHVIELIKSSKPTAHFHTLSFTLRFLVPGDIRYTHCDCAEPAPCSHVPLAVWAFRQLEDNQMGGVISTNKSPFPVPISLLDDIEQNVRELAISGFANLSPLAIARWRRLETKCRDENLIWSAEIIAELLEDHQRYLSHDARFSPTQIVDRLGELCIRSDAIRNDTGAVPQLFIRGSSADQLTTMGSSRLIGLGCGVQMQQHSVTLSAYLQDMNSGTVVAVCRDFTDPPEESQQTPKTCYQLAQTNVIKGISLASLGAGQLLINGGKRSPSYQFIPGRAKATANPQTFNWETLRAPVLAEDFAEIYNHLRTVPPASLRPRRLTENVRVCAIKSVEAVEFSTAEQCVKAVLGDNRGDRALLIHPYHHRSREGTETLLSTLTCKPPESWRFIAGKFHLGSQGLIIEPISLIFEEGDRRKILQPRVDRRETPEPATTAEMSPSSLVANPIASYLADVKEAIADLFLGGLQRASTPTINHWQQLQQTGSTLGFVRLLDPAIALLDILEQKNSTLNQDPHSAAAEAIRIAILLQLSHSISI